ncbi:MAG: adenosylcobinamide-phosphate synthase CbiB [Methyloceanibacter sp.]|jgi:adenosylcobinamide-phosphate synthase
MGISFNVIIILCALLIEVAFGYPVALFRRVQHPVIWMGALLSRLESRLNRSSMPEGRRRLNGLLALAALLVASILPVLVLQYLVVWLLPSIVALALLALLASTLIAQRSLYDHVAAVADALDRHGLEGGRAAVAQIVGRDTEALDAAGVARAGIESLAENFSDGVVAPCVWGALLGLPGMAAYKAVNTADSMIGQLTPRYAAIGWAAAKLDDALNLPASRLAALWIALAALFHRDANFKDALTTMWRDAKLHRSPNAGWPEAAMAGALQLKLTGPRSYHGTPTADAWIGEWCSEATAADIRRALGLYRTACAVQIGMLGLLALFIALP